jgi:hypothetical protein
MIVDVKGHDVMDHVQLHRLPHLFSLSCFYCLLLCSGVAPPRLLWLACTATGGE